MSHDAISHLCVSGACLARPVCAQGCQGARVMWVAAPDPLAPMGKNAQPNGAVPRLISGFRACFYTVL